MNFRGRVAVWATVLAALSTAGWVWRASERSRLAAAIERDSDDEENVAHPLAALALEPEGHGRHADAPGQIPPRGWWDILNRVYAQSMEDRLLSVAGGVAFYCLLALFPALSALVSLYGLVADSSTIADNLGTLSFLLPAGAFDIVAAQIRLAQTSATGSLSLQLVVSFGVSLWSANAGIKAIFDGLNVVYEERERRSFLILNLQSLLFTILAVLAGGMAVGGVIVAPILLRYLYLGSAAQWIITYGKWPVLAVFILLALAVLYRFGPSRSRPKWRWVTVGSLVAMLLWIAMSLAFSWYVSGFGSYQRNYGAMGAVIAFMTWIWLSVTVILLGGELNAEMEHQTAKDTTTGAPRPMGTRGAVVADTLGKAAA